MSTGLHAHGVAWSAGKPQHATGTAEENDSRPSRLAATVSIAAGALALTAIGAWIVGIGTVGVPLWGVNGAQWWSWSYEPATLTSGQTVTGLNAATPLPSGLWPRAQTLPLEHWTGTVVAGPGETWTTTMTADYPLATGPGGSWPLTLGAASASDGTLPDGQIAVLCTTGPCGYPGTVTVLPATAVHATITALGE